jgi:5-methylcytosine-specific restriction endonuclease McrA
VAQGLTSSGSTRAWRTMRALVLARDGYQCQVRLPGCTGMATQVDHIHTRTHGGTDQAANLRAICKQCNRRRGIGGGNVDTTIERKW